MITKAQVQGLAEFARCGFTLEHPDDHVVFLMHENQKVAVFSQTGATPESLQEECSKHLVMKHGWEGCLWPGKEVKSEIEKKMS